MILHYSLAIWKINDNALSLIFFVNAQRSGCTKSWIKSILLKLIKNVSIVNTTKLHIGKNQNFQMLSTEHST